VIAKILAHLEKTAPDQLQAEPALGAHRGCVEVPVIRRICCLRTAMLIRVNEQPKIVPGRESVAEGKNVGELPG
jgi:hypothetical protein